MLAARRTARACPDCRNHLYRLFEHGFSGGNTAAVGTVKFRSYIVWRSQTDRHDKLLNNRPAGQRLHRRLTTSSRLNESDKQPSLRPDDDGLIDEPISAPGPPEDIENHDESDDALAQEYESDPNDFDELSEEDIRRGEEYDAETELEEVFASEDHSIGRLETIEDIVRQARRTFGDTLPKDYLNHEEYVLYERLYGAPLRETTHEDLNLFEEEGEFDEIERQNVLMRATDEEGVYEDIDLGPEGAEFSHREVDEDGNEILVEEQPAMDDATMQELLLAEETAFRGGNRREAEVIMRLRRDMAVANAKAAQEEQYALEQEEQDDQDEEEDASKLSEEEALDKELADEEDFTEDYDGEVGESLRSHPHTLAGRWGTKPSTVNLPKDELVLPIEELLERTNPKHIQEAAEKAFGGPGLPYSAATPQTRKKLQQKHIGLEAGQHKMSEIEADAYMAGVIPGTYAACISTLVECRKRLGSSWLQDLILRKSSREGPRFLDAGAGGAGLVAWRQALQAEWEVLRAQDKVKGKSCKYGKATVLTGPQTLRHRMSRFLDDTTFLPRLPDYLHASNEHFMDVNTPPTQRKYFDVILAPHTLLPLHDDFRRKAQIENLWSLLDPDGGVLILIEKGIPRGFEAIAGARSLLLRKHIASPGESFVDEELQSPLENGERFRKKGPGMIVAPCTNHSTCPMYKHEGTSHGRQDFCHFEQRFIRPPFLQKLMGGKSRNHEDVKFSYVAMRKGIDVRNAKDNSGSPAVIQGESATLRALEGWEDTGDTRLAAAENGERSQAQTDEEIAQSSVDPNFSPYSLPRVILNPLKRHGHVIIDVCTPSATIERWTVSRSFSKQAYRDARKSQHGDLWALGAKVRTTRNVRYGHDIMQLDAKKAARKEARRAKQAAAQAEAKQASTPKVSRSGRKKQLKLAAAEKAAVERAEEEEQDEDEDGDEIDLDNHEEVQAKLEKELAALKNMFGSQNGVRQRKSKSRRWKPEDKPPGPVTAGVDAQPPQFGGGPL